ncbi:hypothetical protein K435DRAFT_451282 [Dendrothele bispora CBS 962.96]|uniref:Uncharacterized protein n=1 Tax=Dendrothele bispora (strain CBS 962.96) TaxID=1314807 RepID=A0A4S8MU18_DENBC|nr:hypothetical protein K435DRAFT_451282 [Dendrothele bispora CBS 962.96]
MIELLPVVAEDISASSARDHLVCVNALMKNTLIRALNQILQLVPSIQSGQSPAFVGFMEYVVVFCDMTCLHLSGDERFLTTPNAEGIALVEVFGPECNPNGKSLRERLEKLREVASSFKESPAEADMSKLEVLLGDGGELGKMMKKQLELMGDKNLGKDIKDEVLRNMIQENIGWISQNSDITVLLPFIVAHHDPSTAGGWPQIPPEGLAELPKMVEVRAECWKFAPFNPVSGEKNVSALHDSQCK